MEIKPGMYRTRDGRKAIVGAVNENAEPEWYAIGWIDGVHRSWCKEGNVFANREAHGDLIAEWREPKRETRVFGLGESGSFWMFRSIDEAKSLGCIGTKTVEVVEGVFE